MADKRNASFHRQRSVLDIGKRARNADKVSAVLPRYVTAPTLEGDAMFCALDRHGVALAPALVTAVMAHRMRQYLAGKTCRDPYQPEIGRFTPPSDRPEGVHIAHYDAVDIVSAPHVLDVVNHPLILEVMGRLLGAKPTIANISIWWSLPAGDGTAQLAENFHRDYDDWRFGKYFVYLSDVDRQSGPHIFIRGSHKQSRLMEIRCYSDREIENVFGAENIETFIGAAGTSFLENSFGFHRGLPPASRPRLALAATYSLQPNPYSPNEPVAQLGRDGISADLDPYINRLYCRGGD